MSNTDQGLARLNKPSGLQETHNQQRRKFLSGTLAALAASPLLAAPRRVIAKDVDTPGDPFILLLTGIYHSVPAGKGPNLGLTTVNLNDGSYSVTKIYPVYGISSEAEHIDQDQAIGNFYVQFAGNLCAYDLPGGAIAMRFDPAPTGAPPGFNGFVTVSDGKGGFFLEGTFELKILEATGVYKSFQGGHNHMVDKLHQLASGQFDEFCFCNISTYDFP